ncbi:sigma-70 family RNA polymerase sigma factor [Stenotrophomonas sp.]|jgi:RNA polymerase sigma-70 factor (ECF subfamily)|uniref:RNA polymerase sigma factor n=1 Tax=Stenotrophomonas sp. TaxID=69392 RepID=UPI0029B20163|nr:sigma-70 family RNA polymerase sigma factor [Stenotrophomonas sp.]MDX3934516.1 sigma-70 family RNA polymerase sigma factor [Stenotrophomonas sp.]
MSGLRSLFLDHYEAFRKRLRRRLGSDDLAMDALQETWLRVERMGSVQPQRNPVAYLFRMAVNAATDQRIAHGRVLTGAEVEALMDESPDYLDPSDVAHGRSEIAALAEALRELPERQRAILIAARIDQQPIDTIADQHGVSSRMIGKDLKKALQHCAGRLDRPLVQRFGPGAGKPS